MVESMHPEESEYKRGYDAMLRLLGRRGRPDGVMTYTDLMAVGAMDAAGQSRQSRFPRICDLLAAATIALLCAMKIPLTSIDIGGRELGMKAAHLALRAIGSGKPEAARTESL